MPWKQLLEQLIREEDGQALIEYSLLVGILTLSLAISLRAISVRTKNVFSTATNALHTTT